MSFLDKAKEAAQTAQAKAAEAAQKAAAKIEETGLVDKAASFADEKTGGKYSDKIAKAAGTAKESVSKLKSDDGAVDVEYSTQFGTEPTETAKEAAEVFEQNPENPPA